MPSTPENSAGESQDPWKLAPPRPTVKKGKKKQTRLQARGVPEPSAPAPETAGGDPGELTIHPSWGPLFPPEDIRAPPSPEAPAAAEPTFDDVLPSILCDPPAPEKVEPVEPAPVQDSITHHFSAISNAQNIAVDTAEDLRDLRLIQNGSPPLAFPWIGDPVTAPDPALSSASPPNGDLRLPSSPNAPKSLPERSSNGGHKTIRRTSMLSYRPPPIDYGDPPPLPHLPQAHFYAAQGHALTGMRKRGKGSSQGDGRFYAFDTLTAAGGDGSETVDNVLLVGDEGSFDVFRVEKEKVCIIGYLQGLRGKVIGAKLVPRMAVDDTLHEYRPLAALIIHGPESPPFLPDNGGLHRSRPAHSGLERIPSATGSPASRPLSNDGERNQQLSRYQTTVEVFSLRTRERVSTLFSSPTVQMDNPVIGLSLSAPAPIGNLRVDANGKHVVVASAASGEIYVFGPHVDRTAVGTGRVSFRCLAKIWTALQPHTNGGFSVSATSSEASTPGGDPEIGDVCLGNPIFSLSPRWLAYVPPKPSAHHSIEGRPYLAKHQAKPPGLYTNTAPPQPQTTCFVDTPEGDSLFNRMAREVTQEFIKGAKWVGDQGMQAWRNYWNKPAQAETATDRFSHGREYFQHHNQPSSQPFPPTHAQANLQSQSGSEPILISLLDLSRFDKGHDASSVQRLHSIATFQAPLGCSFISFAPSGLQLLTASMNGDVQFVWDLMRMASDKSIPTPHSSSMKATGGGSFTSKGPHVRQIARFSRMTAAKIVDVIWTAPTGERLAILTEKGTVHMFDLPMSAFQWPPPRRPVGGRTVLSDSEEDANQAKSLYAATGAASHAVSAAVKMVNIGARPLLAAARGRRSSSGTGAGAGAGSSSGPPGTSKGAQGGRIVAHGFSKSLGAASETINTLRSIGENRLHIPNGTLARSGCARWLTGKEAGLISVVGGDMVRIQEVRAKTTTMKGGKRRSLVGGHLIEVKIPRTSDRPLSPSHMTHPAIDPAESSPRTLVGYWNVRSIVSANISGLHDGLHPLSYAEIETNSPYQPFHTDRRVGLFTYEATTQLASELDLGIPGIVSTEPWVFGQDIGATRVNVSVPLATDHEGVVQEEDILGPMENILHRGKTSEEMDQLVMTTRRRKRGKDANGGLEDGFFEDDCEVLDFASNRV